MQYLRKAWNVIRLIGDCIVIACLYLCLWVTRTKVPD